MTESTEWDATQADSVFYTDACPHGLAFWSPHLMLGFQSDNLPSFQIFGLEVLAVCWKYKPPPVTAPRVTAHSLFLVHFRTRAFSPSSLTSLTLPSIRIHIHYIVP